MSDIVLKDVVARHSIRGIRNLEQLVNWYTANMSCLHSYNSIRKALGLSIQAASSLTSYLSQAYLVFEVNRYHRNLKIQSRDPQKVYLIDNGLRNVSINSTREDLGRLA
ncbi:MAG: DUF4143 domain-containing protein [Bdellovibrionota bacterium]